jgi:streptogramin lyase
MPESEPDIAPGTETQDLARPEAEDLLQEVFGTSIEAPAEFFDELEIEAFRSDNVAVVAPPDSSEDAPAGLLSSSLPLRTEDEMGTMGVVDLDLQPAREHLEPENPLVELEIPTQLSEGISLPESNITIALATTEGQRTASMVGDASAFFPNVAHDADFVVTATPTGVQTYTQLRSAEAPTKQVFQLTLQAGQQLRELDGGARVLAANGETAMDISPPSALDAAGQRVPAALKVVDHTLVISVDPPADAVYPILVDPLYNTYDWMSGPGSWGTPYFEEWKSHADPSFMVVQNFLGRGAGVVARTGSVTPGQGNWNFYVPRFSHDITTVGQPPTSYIRNMKLWNLYYDIAEPKQTWINPYLEIGLWSSGMNKFAAYGYRDGQQGPLTDPYYVYELVNPGEMTDVKVGGFWLKNNTYYNSAERYVTVGQASTEVTDRDIPAFGELGGEPEWVGSAAGSGINYRATDTGLGIYRLRLLYPSASGGTGETVTSLPCTGIGRYPCRRTVEKGWPNLSYNPSLMAQGEHWVKVYASDPVGNQSTVEHGRIKVDHSGPAMSLSGQLTEQAALGTDLPEYTLSFVAVDGDDAAAAAMTPAGGAGKGAGQLERPMGVSTAPDGSVYVVDRLNNRVVKYDSKGKFVLQFGSTGAAEGQFNDPRGIDVAPNGTVWVADLGNDRIQAFSPSGTYLRKAKFSDPASEPYAIASGPGGVLWVTDIGLHRLCKLSENPVTSLLNTTGSSSTSLISPTGVSTDKFGNAWVADGGLGKVVQFDASGKVVFQAGTPGAADGQFDGIVGIDVSPAGNIAITERNNSRVQIFKPDGSFLRKFGTSGAASNQFSEVAGLSFGPDNTLVVADAGNKRIARWSHADQDPQSGAAKVEIKVDGSTTHAKAPGCTTKNCQVTGSWTLDADDYAAGAHKVDVIATDTVGNQTKKTLNVETHGDATNPSISLFGSMTEQQSLGTTRPSYKLVVAAADPAPAGERNSGVVNTSIKVDGSIVDSVSPGCQAGGCSIHREWRLDSDKYPAGPHTVEVKAVDGAGHSTVKTVQIRLDRDTTAPVFSTLGPLYTQPEGWVEQKPYQYEARASDDGGYGVTSINLKIDGEIVGTASQACPIGGCDQLFADGQWVDMESYEGGSHVAELVATDGAGNWKKKTWKINVVPDGQVSKSETIATMEASDETSGTNTVGAGEEGAEEELPMTGNVVLEGESEGYTAPEAAAPLLIDRDPSGGMTISIPAEGVTDEPCPFVQQELFEEQPSEPLPSGEMEGPCELGSSYGSEYIDLEPVVITPIGTSSAATDLGLDDDAAAAVSANVQPNVDQFVRPLYNGAQTFMAIRDTAAPIEYSWRVNLEEDQDLISIDSQHAIVKWDNGPTAFTITAGAAHDAIGTTLPTTISVAGNVLTLYVPHRNPSPAGGGYVYPVTAGPGWQGGFQTYEVMMPPPVEETPEEASEPLEHVEIWENENEGRIRLMSSSPPQWLGKVENGDDKFHYKFRWSECRYSWIKKPSVPKPRSEMLALYVGKCANRVEPLKSGFTVYGWAHMIPGKWVWINDNPPQVQCETWGPSRGAPVNCFARPWKARNGLTVRGDFRLGPAGAGLFEVAECITMYTEIFSSKPFVTLHENIVSYAGANDHFQKCNWPG